MRPLARIALCHATLVAACGGPSGYGSNDLSIMGDAPSPAPDLAAASTGTPIDPRTLDVDLFGVTAFGIPTSTEDEVFVVGAGGTILHSMDSGHTWQQQASGTTRTLRAVRGTLAVGDGGLVLRTADHGSTWTEQPSGTTEDLLGIDNGSSLCGLYVVGRNGVVLVTRDGGLSFDRIDVGTTADLYFATSGGPAFEAIVGGSAGTVARTGGCTGSWTVDHLMTTATLRSGAVYNALMVLLVGEHGTIVSAQPPPTWPPAWVVSAGRDVDLLSAHAANWGEVDRVVYGAADGTTYSTGGVPPPGPPLPAARINAFAWADITIAVGGHGFIWTGQ
jgi:photosystem II stability/assembly factor-like uncharacterized protein